MDASQSRGDNSGTGPWPADTASRTKRGFESRLAVALAIHSRGSAPLFSTGNSVFASFARESTEGTDRIAPTEIDKRWLSISAAISAPSLPVQASVLDTLSEPRDLAFAEAYAIGCSFAQRDLPVADVVGSADEDFSILMESIARFAASPALPRDLRLEIVAQSGEFARRVIAETRRPKSAEASAEATLGLGKLAPDPSGSWLSALQEAASSAKRKMVHVIGPDLFSLLQGLADPSAHFSSVALAAARELMQDWGLLKMFTTLLLARLSGPYPEERAFLEEHLTDIAEHVSTPAEEGVRRLLAKRPSGKRATGRSTDYADRIVNAYERLMGGTRSKNPDAVLGSIVEIYCVDPTLIAFLDWDKIVDIARQQYFITPEAAFVTMLAGSELVSARYPIASMAMGKGAFIGDLMNLLARGRRTNPLPELLAQMRQLPAPAACALCEAVLDRAIFERLAGALPPPKSWLQDLPAGDGGRLSPLRIEALRLAHSRGLLSKDYARSQIEYESDQMRMHYFQSRMRTGRVRIPWREIRWITKEITEEYVPLRLLRSSPLWRDDLRDIIPRISSYISGKIADTILFESAVSIDHALSNNLRHGIVLPRILRAFEDAFRALDRGPPEWEEAKLRDIFGTSSSARILLFRDYVSELVKSFIQEMLTVTPGGELDIEFREELSRAVESYVAGSGPHGGSLEGAVERGALRVITAALARSRETLAVTLKSLLTDELNNVRRYTKENINKDATYFINIFEPLLHEACDEVEQWIGIAEDKGDPISFLLSDVVKLDLLTHYRSDLSNFKVKVLCRRQLSDKFIKSDFHIRGRYLDLFQDLIHNLVSNAFKYSGENLKTEVAIQLDIGEKNVTLRCVNSIAPARIADIEAAHKQTVTLARKPIGPQARQDSLSGFQKIRGAVRQELKRELTVNIPLISPRSRQFVVELTVRDPPEIIDEEA